MVKLLVGNKVDQAAVVSREDAEDWARARGMLFLEASAKTDVGIAQARIFVSQNDNFQNYSLGCWPGVAA